MKKLTKAIILTYVAGIIMIGIAIGVSLLDSAIVALRNCKTGVVVQTIDMKYHCVEIHHDK